MRSGLGTKARQALLWGAGFQLFRDLLQFGVMLVMVRLLAPEIYGQFGMANSIMGFIGIVAVGKFAAHILQVRDGTKIDLQTYFTAGVVIQSVLFIVTNVIALGLRWVDEYAPIAPLLHVMSLGLLLEAVTDLRVKVLEREMAWPRLRILGIIGLCANALLMVGMGLAGAGVYALVVPGFFVSIPFAVDLFVHMRWRPTWAWSWAEFRGAWYFGLSRAGSGALNATRALLESGLITGLLGFAVLGVFGRATALAQMFCGRVAGEVFTAIYPVLTRYEVGSPEFRRAGALVLRGVAWTIMPIGVLFALMAPVIVHTLYGAKWDEVVPLLPWAMWAGILGGVVYGEYMLLLASAGEKKCLLHDALAFAAVAAALFLVLPVGIVSYLKAMVVIHIGSAVLIGYWLLQRGAVAWDGLSNALIPSGIAVALAVVAVRGTAAIVAVERDSLLIDALLSALFLAVYAATLRLVFSAALRELVEQLPGRRTIARALLLAG